MRSFLASTATLGLTAGLVLTGPASAAHYSDGPATMTLDGCATVQSSTPVEGCSYLAMKYEGKPYYTFVTAPGALSWEGSLSGDAVRFPEKTWPTLTKLPMSTATITSGPISGSVDATGRVQLSMDYSILVNALGDLCTLSGTAQLSSEGVEWLSGATTGRNYDPLTGRFAVVTTGVSPTAATGNCIRVTEFAYDIATGVGWYLTGTLTIPAPAPVPPAADQPQTAVVSLPTRIKAHGKTVLLPGAVMTNAGRAAVPTVTWSRKKKAAGTNLKWARVRYASSGKVVLRTTAKAKRLHVKLHLQAPAVEGYLAYDFVKKWRVVR